MITHVCDHAPVPPKQALFARATCQCQFLTSIGFEKYLQSDEFQYIQDESITTRTHKLPRIDTVPTILARLAVEILTPPKNFRCPLCLETIGRKGPTGHLRKDHQVDKPTFFAFRPNRNMFIRRLACGHCFSCFAIEAAFRLHYHRATCPALIIG